MNIFRKIVFGIVWIVMVISIFTGDNHGYSLMFDPFSLLIAGIISSIKINKKIVEAKNKSDNQFVQDTLQKEQQGNQATGQIANRYFKDDLVNYMNFLNKKM